MNKKKLPTGDDYQIAISSGIVHFAYIKWSRKYRGGELLYRRSSTLANRWSKDRVLSTDDGYSSYVCNVSAPQNGNVYIAWRDARLGSYRWGMSMMFRKSTDGGLTWNEEKIVVPFPEVGTGQMSSEKFFGNVIATTWYLDTASSGHRIKVRSSLDAGDTWFREQVLTPKSFYAIYPTVAVSQKHIVVGWEEVVSSSPGYNPFYVYVRSSTILPIKKTETNTELNRQPIPYLHTYPNPFNPKTILSFVIGNSSFVSLKIYDVVGRNVATLINNEKYYSGKYEMEFDASSLPSGVYFSRLTVETMYGDIYTEIKKLMVVK
jgi:hypothetical protein